MQHRKTIIKTRQYYNIIHNTLIWVSWKLSQIKYGWSESCDKRICSLFDVNWTICNYASRESVRIHYPNNLVSSKFRIVSKSIRFCKYNGLKWSEFSLGPDYNVLESKFWFWCCKMMRYYLVAKWFVAWMIDDSSSYRLQNVVKIQISSEIYNYLSKEFKTVVCFSQDWNFERRSGVRIDINSKRLTRLDFYHVEECCFLLRTKCVLYSWMDLCVCVDCILCKIFCIFFKRRMQVICMTIVWLKMFLYFG